MKNRSKLIWRLITMAGVVFLLFSGVYFLFSSTSDSNHARRGPSAPTSSADPTFTTIRGVRLRSAKLERRAMGMASGP